MKRVLQIASAGFDKNIGRFLFLFIFSILTINLSGQKIQTMLSETWTSSIWVKSFQTTNTYDVNGYALTSATQSWDVPSSSWKDMVRSNFVNNPDGTANVVTSQSWSGSAWTDASRITYTYTASKKIETAVMEMWMVAIWQKLSRQVDTYDGSGYLTTEASQSWDMISSTWKNNIQIIYINNSNGNPTLETTQIWDGVSAWTNSTRSTFTYYALNKVLTEVSDKWDSGIWKVNSRETITYDGSGYLTNSLSQQWDSGSSTWKNDTQSNYTNNPNGTASVITLQSWNGSLWNNSQKLTYTYAPSTNISESIKEAEYTIYPNPAHNVITIKSGNRVPGSSYSITDQTGKLMLKGKLMDEIISIDISQLGNGIYFLNIGGKSQNTFKVIKQGVK